MAYDLALNCFRSSPVETLRLPESVAASLLKSKAFERWEKGRGANGKAIVEILKRIDSVTTAVGNLAKRLSKR